MKTRDVKTIIRFGSMIFTASFLISCRQHSGGSAGDLERQARAYLQPQLHDGDTTNSLSAKFGPPEYQHETGTHELSMGVFFLDDNHAALAAGVGGFTAFFTNNQLVHWDPIYHR